MSRINRSRGIRLRTASEVSKALLRHKYAVARASDFEVSEDFLNEWQNFQKSWENLVLDPYLPDTSSYRFRRYSRFELDRLTCSLTELPHRAYFQKAEYNSVAGGILRKFEAIDQKIYQHNILRDTIFVDAELLWTLHSHERWHVDVHQIRITASQQDQGKVVPEGAHQDGLTFIATHLIERIQVTGGVSSLCDLDGQLIDSFTLKDPLDVFYALDEEVMHDASPIVVEKKNTSGYRDSLLIGFRPIIEE